MSIDETWSYEESLYFIVNVKRYYEDITLSFSVFGGNNRCFEDVRNLKRKIYSLEFEEWKKDKLWEFLNNDIDYSVLWSFVRGANENN